ncbi:MAG TPA: major capsid protein [Hyphomicrobiaceae bacterium]|nr:major capsid protein [Hyphomicrobiaceae bacterium]
MPGIITLDIFNNDAFSLASLTARYNGETSMYVPGQIGRLGIFEEGGVSTLTVMIEERDGSLSLIEPSKRGGPGETVGTNRDKLRSFVIPHLQRDDAVMADEVQGRRAFGTDKDVETVQSVVDRKVNRHLRDLDATVEHHRVGAFKGVVLSKSGATLWNLYNEFGIAEPAAVNFELDNAATNVRLKCEQLVREVEDELDTPYTGIHAMCGNDYWDKLTEHKSVREVWLAAQKAAELLGKKADTIQIGGITFERYRTGKKATAGNGGAGFFAANEARFVPKGVPELFITRFAPADYEETVNTDGLPRYVKQWAMPNGKGRNIEVQSNPLNICTRPAVLRKGVVAA